MLIFGLFLVWLGFVIVAYDIDKKLKKIKKEIEDIKYSINREYYEALQKSKRGD